MDKRFIEESFPVQEISKEAAREKSIRHGHLSTLHIWWARRPLSSSRATNYAALIPAPTDEIDWVKKRNFIIELSKWENSLNLNLVEKARKDIITYNGGVAPKVLDPFSGGGAIPLEALRLGCDTYANDYNPLAVLIEKCTLEYPQKYGNPSKWSENIDFIKDVEKWGGWVLNESEKEISKFYPPDENGHIPIGYFWVRTLPCQNPACGAEIPLLKQYWRSNKKNKKIALKPIITTNIVEFELVGQNNNIPQDFDPSKGTVNRSIVTCPVCGTTIEAKKTRDLFQNNYSRDRMVAVVLKDPNKKGKIYRIANKDDIKSFLSAEKYLELKRQKLKNEMGIDPIPTEEIPQHMTGCIAPPNFGMNTWGDLFNSRQKLSIITFMDKIRQSQKLMYEEGLNVDYIKAIISVLSMIFGRLLDKNATLVDYDAPYEKISHVFNRQALPITWDYVELNVFSGSNGDWISNERWVKKFLVHAIKSRTSFANVTQSSAIDLPYPDNYFDAIFTDPPYYNSVPYADLSDYFYVWLKRLLGDIYPDLFSTPFSPKSGEIAEMVGWDKERYKNKDKKFFEDNIRKSFDEMERILKKDGIITIVYAHKTNEGWETIINALLDSGLTVTASWPISTEMRARLRARNSAALASSIYIIARKYDKKELGWYKDVKSEIVNYVPQKLDKLWEEGISGADFFIAAIGSAIEIFGKYEKILDNEGNEIRADKLLNFVRDVVTNYTVHQILHNGIAEELSPLTKFYLMWRWNYQEARIPFDDARKLAQSAGINLEREWNKGFIIKRGEFITVIGPEKRDMESLKDSLELIDVLHCTCLLWKDGKKDEMKSILKKSGYGDGDALYKVAQAISETLPNNSSEKKMIEGFLAGRDRIIQDIREDESQTKLV